MDLRKLEEYVDSHSSGARKTIGSGDCRNDHQGIGIPVSSETLARLMFDATCFADNLSASSLSDVRRVKVA